MKQRLLFFEDGGTGDVDPYEQLLDDISYLPARELYQKLVMEGVIVPVEERRIWNESYGLMEFGVFTHDMSFGEFVDLGSVRDHYAEIVKKVATKEAEDYAEARFQLRKEGKENVRKLTEAYRTATQRTPPSQVR